MNALGLPIYKFVPDHARGMPDRLIALPDERVVWVETKTVGGAVSPFQKYRHSIMRKAGQRVEVIWTVEQADEFSERLAAELELSGRFDARPSPRV